MTIGARTQIYAHAKKYVFVNDNWNSEMVYDICIANVFAGAGVDGAAAFLSCFSSEFRKYKY